MYLRFFFDNLWRWKLGVIELDTPPTNFAPALDELNKNQFPDEFAEIQKLAHNRMIMGYFRYGDIHRQNLDGYDTVAEAHKRINKYSQDHNLEHLVDALNMIQIEYFKAKKAGKRLHPIDDGEHAEYKPIKD
jgi:hypothetical protein